MIAVDAWQPADGLTLEPNALLAAKEQVRCLALTAGPGAGKTEMLAQRADFLLRTGTCRYPKRILAISFKVDASKNLKERVQRRCGADLASRFDSYTFHAFAKRIIDRFRPVLTGKDALEPGYKLGSSKITHKQIEFGDLIPLAIQILQKSKLARNAIRQTYSDVFLDEFQDCTDKQYDLVKLAFHGTGIRLTAVGDTKQKIMGWAGALDGIFQTFATDFAATPLNMYRNFRSKPTLLRLQNEIIRVLDLASVMPEEQIAGNEGEVLAWGFEDSQQEAEHLADRIAGWINHELVPHSEIAVLISKQPDLYANHLNAALEAKGIPYRNEQQLQDITTEPAARLVVDYLSCIYGKREPKSWVRLMNLLVPFADDEVQANTRRDFDRLIKAQRKSASLLELIDEPYSGWWESVRGFLNKIPRETLVALSSDYESPDRLKEVVRDTKARIVELLKIEPELPKALERFVDDKAVRILTIHKSKGLEFDSVIILGVENQTFWGKPDAERCGFFVGVSRAKRRLVVTMSQHRETPPSNPYRWQEERTPHKEFFGYVMPFVSKKMKNEFLKPGWRRVRFGDVVRLSKARSQDPLADGIERYVGLEHLEPGDLRIRSWGSVADGVTFTSVFQPGQVLFGKRRAYQRKVAVADFSGVCSGDIYVLETKDAQVLLPELLPFICQTDAFFDHAVGTSAGSLSPRTNWTSLADFEFAIPTVDEQLRAVAALTAFDECFESFRSLQAHGNALLQSLLDRMWNMFPHQKIGALIEDGLIAPPQDGNHGEKHPKASDYVPEGVPFVMASDLKGGEVDFANCSKIPEVLARTLRIGFAKSGDILLSHKGTVGEVARLGELATDFVMLTPQVTYYRVADQSRLAPDWLYFSFKTPGFKRLLEQYGKQSTRAYVGITTQRELSIPVAVTQDQSQIISELLAAEKAVSAAALRATAVAELRQRLLAEALA